MFQNRTHKLISMCNHSSKEETKEDTLASKLHCIDSVLLDDHNSKNESCQNEEITMGLKSTLFIEPSTSSAGPSNSLAEPSTSGVAFTDHEPLDPDTWLDSDEDPPYSPDGNISSDSSEDIPVKKKRKLLKRTQGCHDSQNSQVIHTHDAVNNVPQQSELNQEINTENNQVGEAIPFKKRKKRISLKGRSREARLMRKTCRNKGQQYITESGKTVSEKKWLPLENCKLKCKDRILEEDTRNLFQEFWNIGDYSKRASYISALITTHEKINSKKKVDSPKKRKNRSVTHEYQLRINGEFVRICKSCFMKVFAITPKFIEVVCGKAKNSVSGIVPNDCRGKHKPANALPDDIIKFARDHILSIPSYVSHYSRRHTDKRYLPAHYSLSLMYKEYKEQCGTKFVSRTIYEKLFRQLNLAIHAPKNDTCNTCDKLAMQIRCSEGDEKLALTKTLEDHHQSADDAYKSKETDKNSAKDDGKTTLTFDLQQCLPTPDLQSSVVFYKRQLWTFNLTVHDSKDNQPYCYMWSEADGGRGSNQIASCVAKHLNTYLPPQVKHVVLYSDTCGGQNKNSNMLGMCLSVIKNHSNLETIDHKYLVPGHTHMECDAAHAQIEKRKKRMKTPIYHPHDWMQLVRQTGEKRKFNVIEMRKEDFFQYSELFENTKIEKDRPLKMPMKTGKKIYNDKGDRFLWQEVRWLRFSKSSPKVLYKKTLDENDGFQSISVIKPGQSRNRLVPPVSYTTNVPITHQKKMDLLSLLHLIPPVFHDYYKNLTTTNNKRDVLPDIVIEEEQED